MTQFIIRTEEQIMADFIDVTPRQPSPARPLAGSSIVRVGPTISIQNLSTIVNDIDAAAVVAALQIQLDRDWQPIWGTTATLNFLTRRQTIPTGTWPLYILDTSDVSGALGYHDEFNIRVPFGKIFAKDCIKYGYSWTVTLSHELLEIMADPFINLTVFKQATNTAGVIYAYEVSDPVESDVYGYKINNVLVSDFVWPSWFDLYATASRYDQRNVVTAPFQILPGGYMSIFNVSGRNVWTMITHKDVEIDSWGRPGWRAKERM